MVVKAAYLRPVTAAAFLLLYGKLTCFESQHTGEGRSRDFQNKRCRVPIQLPKATSIT
jgi:hypothetical protein